MEKAEGNQPTAADVNEVVFEILQPEGHATRPANRRERRVELVARLKDCVKQRSWKKVAQMLQELEGLL
ncbi:hypothetical protein [Haloferula sp.]|uniref:hypothetical protein n=1 Tax=Haloferula sp. TaxID=2497595 RepID=UPI003C75751C